MAIKSGYTPDSTYDWRKNPANSISNIIHPDGQKHTPVCEKASGGMKKTIHPDGSDHPGGWPKASGGMKKERKKGAISQDQFRSMGWQERLELVKHYQNVKDKDFDDGTFAFSVTTFKNLCAELHLNKCIVDMEHQTITEKTDSHDDNTNVITISREKRENVKEKTFTLSSSTLALINELLSDVKITNEERSKIIDSIITDAFSNALTAKRDGRFSVEYAEKQEVKEVRNTLM